MPFDETKMIKASDIVAHPDEIRLILQPTILISDYSMSMTYTSFIAAVNILIEDGWRIDPATNYSGYLMALCYNPRHKRKNSSPDVQEG